MDVKLRVRSGKLAGKEIPLTKAQFTIGRGEECSLRAGSEAISRQHCLLTISPTGVEAQDLQSRNGTWVNDERIEKPTTLNLGDILRVGPLEFDVLIGATTAAVGAQTIAGPTAVAPQPAATDGAPQPVNSAAAGAATPKRVKRPAVTRESAAQLNESIAEWLGMTADGAPAQAQNETKTITFSNTTPVGPVPTGGTNRVDPPAPKDSREAAANVLKQLSRRR